MSSSSIKVAIRCRPLLGQERPSGGLDIQNRRILLDSKTYDPDYTFPPTATQDDVFHACRPILQCVKEGMNGTIMVYGQTGTGKTYTMLGNDAQELGLVHKVVAEMLDYVQQKTVDGGQCALTLSMIEIYNERLTDMLSPNGEEEVTLISGFPRFTHKVTLCRVNDAIDTIQRGLAWRHTATTLMNDRSSRSHVVFIFDLEEYNAFTDQTDVAHLFMIDLAGSESLKKSQASGVAAGEAGKINKSLLALKSVFLALSNTNEATRPSHVPYRDSKLTELLQDSIGGTARTLMIACISSVGRDIEETKSTLLYAVKARSIRNAANTEKEKLLVRLRSMEVENQKLRNRLQERVSERGGYYVTKEEHEQTQEMEESYGKLKEAMVQLMQDRQSSDARLHIWESQTKVLHALLEDKETELQNFKEIYYEALRRFENQAATLQRMVRGGVGEAKHAVQLSFADNYARLHTWRTELLNALEEPLPTTTPVLHDDHPEKDERPQQQQLSMQEAESTAHTLSKDRHSTPTPPQAASALITTGMNTRTLTPPISPTRKESNSNGSNSTNVNSQGYGTNMYTVLSSSSSYTTTTAVGNGRATGASRSARGSTASSLQRVSAATASVSISPTRRGGGCGRSRLGGGTSIASANTSRRPTQTSPSLAACHHPPLLPTGPLTALPSPSTTTTTTTSMTTAATPLRVQKDGRPAEEEGQKDVEGSTVSQAVVEAVGPLQMGSVGGPCSSPLRLPKAAPPSPSQLPSWSAVLAQHDAQCVRTVHRLNDAVATMLDECIRAFEHYRSQAEAAEDRRRGGLEDVCNRLRSELDTHLIQLQRINAASERDVRDAWSTLSDQLQLRVRLRPTAEAAPFQQVVRHACSEVVRHAAQAFPQPSTPAPAEAAMDIIVQNAQRCSAAFAVHALNPLASSAVAFQLPFANTAVTALPSSSSSSLASSPLVSKAAVSAAAASGSVGSPALLDLVPMARLSPPLSSETAGAIAGSGRRTARSSLPPTSQSRDDDKSKEDERVGNEEGDMAVNSSSPMRDARLSPAPTSSQTQRASARASSLRSSAALSSMPVNRVTGRSTDGSRRGGGIGGGVKRARSNASSQRGEASSRRTTTTHRGLR